MNDILRKAYDPSSFRKEGHELVDMIANYLQDCLDHKNMPVLPWVDANEQHQDWKAFFNDGGNIVMQYDFSTVIIYWVGSSIVSMILASTLRKIKVRA